MNGWKRLAVAIIEQACLDYAAAVRAIEKLENKKLGSATTRILEEEIKEQKREMERIENFIRSPIYAFYCDIDPERFLQLLRQRGGKRNNKVYKY